MHNPHLFPTEPITSFFTYIQVKNPRNLLRLRGFIYYVALRLIIVRCSLRR